MITVKANGKINLTLDILGERSDGYHEVEMIMQSINISDILTLKKIDNNDIILNCAVDGITDKHDNLIYKAAELFLRTYKINSGVEISAEKNIPVAAGLAGGSSDAAAVLRGLNTLFELDLSSDELCRLAAQLGSDVPFCIRGGTMLAKGRGEKIFPAAPFINCALVIIKPVISISTAWAYGNYAEGKVKKHPDSSLMLDELKKGNIDGICRLLGNVLETVTIEAYPQLAVYKEKLCRYGAKAALMSGSGPSIFAVCENAVSAKQTAARMRADYPDIGVYEAMPVNAVE